MPRYYFHVLDDQDTSDDEGAELASLEDARVWAIKAARVLMCETVTAAGRITLSHRIDIEDEDHALVESVTFGEAVDIIE